jgi:hypothetical protein
MKRATSCGVKCRRRPAPGLAMEGERQIQEHGAHRRVVDAVGSEVRLREVLDDGHQPAGAVELADRLVDPVRVEHRAQVGVLTGHERAQTCGRVRGLGKHAVELHRAPEHRERNHHPTPHDGRQHVLHEVRGSRDVVDERGAIHRAGS